MILTEMRITMYLKMGKFGSLYTYQVTQIPMEYTLCIDTSMSSWKLSGKRNTKNTSRKSPSTENIETNEKNVRDKTNEQPNDTHNKITNNDINERDNQSCWPSGTGAIVRDSMVNGIDEKRLSQKYSRVKVFHFSGARIEDLNHYIMPIIKNKPDYLILHVETNDAKQIHPEKLWTIYWC